MTRRRKLLFSATTLVALGVLALPGVHWRLYGWARGEPFYDGRPTSYWRGLVIRGEMMVYWPLKGGGDPSIEVGEPPSGVVGDMVERIADGTGLYPRRHT